MLAEVSWYNDPLFVAVVVVILTLATGRVGGWLEGRIRRRERAAALRIAFAAETDKIVASLESVVREALASLKNGEPYLIRDLVAPCAVYEANVSRIGELGDMQLVHFLVGAYSHLAEIRGRCVARGSDSHLVEIPVSVASLVAAWLFAVSANSILRQMVRDTVPRALEPTLSQEDADRLNVTVEFVKSMLHDERQAPSEGESSIQRVRKTYPRAYDRWSSEEDDRLRSGFARGQSVRELAQLFSRQPSAIRSRLNKLGLA